MRRIRRGFPRSLPLEDGGEFLGQVRDEKISPRDCAGVCDDCGRAEMGEEPNYRQDEDGQGAGEDGRDDEREARHEGDGQEGKADEERQHLVESLLLIVGLEEEQKDETKMFRLYL